MGLIEGTLKNYPNPVLVETGTYFGDGVEAAKRAGFGKIISIEVSKIICEEVQKRFAKDNNITILCGDSSLILWSVIKDIKERITFILDAHDLGFGEDTRENRNGLECWPLVKELNIIACHPRKDHIIIIDDVSYFEHNFGTSIEEIKLLLHKINPDYQIHFIPGIVDGGAIVPEEVMIVEIKEAK